MTRISLILLPLLLVAGCLTRNKIRNLPADAGTQRTYKKAFDDVLQASRDAVSEGFRIRDDLARSENAWMLLATQGLQANTAGRFARVLVERRTGDVSVRVVVRSKVESQDASLTDTAIANDIHEKIAKRLE